MNLSLKFLAVLIGAYFISACDSYEFPSSPYAKVETQNVTTISEMSATFQAKILHYGDKPIINSGFIWGLERSLLNYASEKIELGAITESASFESVISSGLQKDEIYFVRAFVETADYVVYANVVSYQQK